MTPESSSYRFLAQLCTRITDGTHQTPNYQDQGVIFISAKNIKDGQLDFADRKYITREEHQFLTKSAKPIPGDLLLTKSGSLGDVAIIPELDFEFSIFESLALLKPRRNLVDSSYLYQYIRSPEAARHFHGITTGLAVKHLHLADLRKLKVFLPPLKHQREIAEQLSTWDTAIQKTAQLIAAKERHYSHELSRLISRGQHPHTHVGTFAEEVSARNRGGSPAFLGDFLTESREPDTEQDSAKRLTVRLHLQGVEPRPVRGTERDGATAYFRRRAGQLIYGKQNIFRGAIGIVPPELDGFASTQDLPAFDIADGIDPQWLYFWLSRKDFYNSLEALAAGSGSKRLHPEAFFKIRVIVPDLATQIAIARYLSALREEIDLLGQSVAALKTQKRGLMQKLLTGQWRLKVDNSEVTTQAKEVTHG